MAGDRRGLASWNDVRYFLAVAASGSSNIAAQELGLDHTTVSRRLREMQSELGAQLFERKGNRMVLTAAGLDVLANAKAMEASAQAFVRKASGSSGDLKGTVRLNMTEGLGTYWLMPGMQPFQQRNPNLRINWLTTNSVLLKLDHEAEIGLWWEAPRVPALVGRKLGVVRYSLFASRAYEERFGLPKSTDDFVRHRFLNYNGYQANSCLKPWNALMNRYPPATTVESAMASEPMINSGNFIALLPDYARHIVPHWTNIDLELGVRLEVWIVYHEDRRRDSLVRAIVDEIVQLAQSSQDVWFHRDK